MPAVQPELRTPAITTRAVRIIRIPVITRAPTRNTAPMAPTTRMDISAPMAAGTIPRPEPQERKPQRPETPPHQATAANSSHRTGMTAPSPIVRRGGQTVRRLAEMDARHGPNPSADTPVCARAVPSARRCTSRICTNPSLTAVVAAAGGNPH